MQTNQKRILLGITGGIAAYKSCEIVRLLKKANYDVEVVMTQNATRFVSPETFAALSANEVLTELSITKNGMNHIAPIRKADCFLIAPATANTIAKIANGIADNLLTTLAAARGNCPLLLAPAMNIEMWNNPAFQRQLQQLKQDGVEILTPNSGYLACGEEGIGRMQEPQDIVEKVSFSFQPKILKNKKILITGGATFEKIDPVRGITNISSGQMAIAINKACLAAGAETFTVFGEMKNIASSTKKSALQMQEEVMEILQKQKIDIFIAVAAVADYRIKNQSNHKVKKKNGIIPTIELEENPDILATVAALKNPPFCVGFAAESENVEEYARQKKAKKQIPMIIANNVANAMGKESTEITIIDDEKETKIARCNKNDAALAIIQRISELI